MPFACDVGRGAVRRLRHRLRVARAQPRRETEAADQRRAEIREDVAEEVRRDDHVEALREHRKLRGERVRPARL